MRDITPPEPKAVFNITAVKPGGTYRTEVNTTVIFDASPSTDNAGIVNYTWNIDSPEESLELEGAEVEYVFGRPGTYTVTLRVVDAERNAGELVFEVVVAEVVVGDDDNDDDITPGEDDVNGTVEEQDESGVIVWVVMAGVVVIAVIVGAVIVAVFVLKKGGKEK